MSGITSKLSQDGSRVTISIAGRFDFSLHREFRDAYREHSAIGQKFVLDMSATEYMDSSALGMLLLLREHTGGDKGRVIIRNASATVDKIMRIANFDKLFDMPASGEVATP